MKIVAAVHAPSLLIVVGMSLLDFSLGWSSRGDVNCNGCYNKQRSMSSKTTTALFLLIAPDDEHITLAEGMSPIIATTTTTRRAAFRKTLTTLVGGVTASTALLSSSPTILVEAAHADVTNKIASSTALRAMTRTQTQMPTKLLPDVQANNFIGVKARLREPPFDLVRKNGLILVRGGEDGPKAKELVKSYKALIATFEKIDATASLGMRGRSIDQFEMSQEYDAIVVALEAFLKVGTDAAEIPLQEQPSMQDNLKYGSIDSKVLRGD